MFRDNEQSHPPKYHDNMEDDAPDLEQIRKDESEMRSALMERGFPSCYGSQSVNTEQLGDGRNAREFRAMMQDDAFAGDFCEGGNIALFDRDSEHNEAACWLFGRSLFVRRFEVYAIEAPVFVRDVQRWMTTERFVERVNDARVVMLMMCTHRSPRIDASWTPRECEDLQMFVRRMIHSNKSLIIHGESDVGDSQRFEEFGGFIHSRARHISKV